MTGLARALLVLVMCASPLTAVGAEPDARAREAVVDAQRRFFEAYRTCDAAAVERLTVGDMLYFHSSGWLQSNRAEFLKTIAGDCIFDVLRFDVAQVRVHGDTALIYGDVRVKVRNAPANAAPLKAMQVFVRVDGEWRLLANQSSEPVPLGSSATLPRKAR